MEQDSSSGSFWWFFVWLLAGAIACSIIMPALVEVKKRKEEQHKRFRSSEYGSMALQAAYLLYYDYKPQCEYDSADNDEYWKLLAKELGCSEDVDPNLIHVHKLQLFAQKVIDEGQRRIEKTLQDTRKIRREVGEHESYAQKLKQEIAEARDQLQ